LSSAGALGLVTGGAGGGTPINNQPTGNGATQGTGQEVGKVYRLSDGTFVFAPSGTVNTGGANGGASSTTGAAPNTAVPTNATTIPQPSATTGVPPTTTTP
jgi:hypothetical protein